MRGKAGEGAVCTVGLGAHCAREESSFFPDVAVPEALALFHGASAHLVYLDVVFAEFMRVGILCGMGEGSGGRGVGCSLCRLWLLASGRQSFGRQRFRHDVSGLWVGGSEGAREKVEKGMG